jgi:peptide/nickel transport system permease protein
MTAFEETPQVGTGVTDVDRARRLRTTRGLLLAATPLALFALLAVLGPAIWPYDPVFTDTGVRLLPPLSRLPDGSMAVFGTDSVGRDLLTQIIQGARVSMVVGVATVVLAGLLGTLLGLLSGYVGGRLDALVMRVADIQLAFPSILLAILIAAVIGPSVVNVIFTLAITKWVVFARMARSSALAIREREHVSAAKVLGASGWRILWQEILPSSVGPLLVLVTTQFGLVIVAEAALSYLGLGTPQSVPSWGLIIANGRDYLTTAWWISTIPGVALVLLVLCAGLLGDRLRDQLDPERRSL